MTYPRMCEVCASPDRAKIEAAIAARRPAHLIARQFDLEIYNVRTHSGSHPRMSARRIADLARPNNRR